RNCAFCCRKFARPRSFPYARWKVRCISTIYSRSSRFRPQSDWLIRASSTHLRVPAGRSSMGSSRPRDRLPILSALAATRESRHALTQAGHVLVGVSVLGLFLSFLGLLLFLPRWGSTHHRRDHLPPRGAQFCCGQFFF